MSDVDVEVYTCVSVFWFISWPGPGHVRPETAVLARRPILLVLPLQERSCNAQGISLDVHESSWTATRTRCPAPLRQIITNIQGKAKGRCSVLPPPDIELFKKNISIVSINWACPSFVTNARVHPASFSEHSLFLHFKNFKLFRRVDYNHRKIVSSHRHTKIRWKNIYLYCVANVQKNLLMCVISQNQWIKIQQSSGELEIINTKWKNNFK